MFNKYTVPVLLLLLMLITVGCFNSNAPKERFQKYTVSWQKQDFAAMYNMLSPETKKKIKKEAFIKRYQDIYNGIEASQISIKTHYPEKLQTDKNGLVHIPYTLTIQTLAGPINARQEALLLNQGKEWYINWNEQMIIPGLKEGEKVGAHIVSAQRGEIKDRNGKQLATNGQATSIGIVLKNTPDKEITIKQISDITGLTTEQINNKLKATWVEPDLFVPIIKLAQDDTRVAPLLAITGVAKQTVNIRTYPYKDIAAHLTGYIGSITAEELKAHKDNGYNQNSIIGKTGLEQIYEKRLKGTNGGELYITDAAGNNKVTLAQQAAKNGEDIQLAIDIEIQKELYNQLQGDMGTAIAINPKSGEVLSMVSTPSYDPNLFVLGISTNQWNELNNNPKKPLINRYAHAYVPGSTFKPVTASIGLKIGTLKPSDAIDIKGLKWQAESSWGNFCVTRVTDPGKPVNLMDAFIYSDNIYFAQQALKIGKENFIKEAVNFGIGEKIPFDYPLTSSQITSKGKIDNDVQLADTGYGQGKVEMNPLQLSLIYTTLVNDGNMLKPVLELNKVNSNKYWHEKVITPEIANSILTNLTQVVENPQGTAHTALIPGIPIAGKTGTAELKQNSEDKNAKENGWFVALNTKDPKLLITMMVEGVPNGQGSHYVLPKVKNVMEKFVK